MAQKSADQRIPNKRSKQSQNNYWMRDHKRYGRKNSQDCSEKIYLRLFRS